MTMPRETGSEMAACPTCGGPVPVVVTPYGSTSPGLCPKCSPEDARQSAAAAVTPRETGTSVKVESTEGGA